MSYNFGQFRSSQIQENAYSEDIKSSLSLDWKDSQTEGEVAFSNMYGTGVSFQHQTYYYIRFHIQQNKDTVQKFYLKLSMENASIQDEQQQQIIEEFVVNQGENIQWFEAIINPNTSYDQILWELQRSYIDYTTENSRGTSGRLMTVQVDELTILNNIINSLTGIRNLSKIGVQGPPSLLMCINGQQIRIGRSGIYEINNPGISISFIGFVPKNTSDYFIMDYEY